MPGTSKCRGRFRACIAESRCGTLAAWQAQLHLVKRWSTTSYSTHTERTQPSYTAILLGTARTSSHFLRADILILEDRWPETA